MTNDIHDIIIIGGGASGLAAAVTAAHEGCDVVLAERNARVGKKLITTGNGRCNISNSGELQGRYHGGKAFAMDCFGSVGLDETEEFFSSIGIPFCELEEGKLYPVSLQAGSVVDALRFEADRVGVKTLLSFNAKSAVKRGEYFAVVSEEGAELLCKRLIVCAGGSAAPKTGSDSSGVRLLEAFGHTKTPLYPSIVQLTTDKTFIKPLKGIKVNAQLTAKVAGVNKSEYGELLFTEYGISGPPVLQFGRFARELDGGVINVNMLPDIDEKWLFGELCKRRKQLYDLPAASVFMGILHSRLGETVMRASVKDVSGKNAADLSDSDLSAAVKTVKRLPVRVTGTLGFDNAQVTAGGIKTTEFSSKDMQSLKVSGLYAAGEVLDVDGDCGGFNLQWAWSSGILAGRCAAHSLK